MQSSTRGAVLDELCSARAGGAGSGRTRGAVLDTPAPCPACQVHGVGAATAAEWIARGVTSLADAEERGLLNERQKMGARFAEDLKLRIPRAEVTLIAAAVETARWQHAARELTRARPA